MAASHSHSDQVNRFRQVKMNRFRQVKMNRFRQVKMNRFRQVKMNRFRQVKMNRFRQVKRMVMIYISTFYLLSSLVCTKNFPFPLSVPSQL